MAEIHPEFLTRLQIMDIMPEYSPNSVRAWVSQYFKKLNIMEIVSNPDFDSTKHASSQLNSRYLFRLNSDGLKLAERHRAELVRLDCIKLCE
ncbi:MAG: hypothetical protein JKY48_15280 [Flavobacteriales bacterium]|nr:hypothetical protein [Flavobacteriales bacterium]